MPYELRGKCVYNKKTGENKGCSDTVAKAEAHMRALYAHEEDEETIQKESLKVDKSEKLNISKFIDSVLSKNYSDANKYLNTAVDIKLQSMIQDEINTPLF